MEPPPQISPKSLADYLDVMSKTAFQSGMSRKVVEKKWAGTREAFHGFDPMAVASFSDRDVDALATDTASSVTAGRSKQRSTMLDRCWS